MAVEREVEVLAGGVSLGGTLAVPEGAQGLVIFAHGSGSSRHSPRNRYVAYTLRADGGNRRGGLEGRTGGPGRGCTETGDGADAAHRGRVG
jgi:hypothetical protein